MQFAKLFYTISIVTCVLACCTTHADTCYDPNYNSYYNCNGDEYIAPVVAGLLFGAILSSNNGYGHRGYYSDHRNYAGHRGGYGGHGRHH
jgi:hypothetical protein